MPLGSLERWLQPADRDVRLELRFTRCWAEADSPFPRWKARSLNAGSMAKTWSKMSGLEAFVGHPVLVLTEDIDLQRKAVLGRWQLPHLER